MARLFDSIGALTAAVLAAVSMVFGLSMFGSMPLAWAFSGSSGYLYVAGILIFACVALFSAWKHGIQLVGQSFEVTQLRREVALRRIVGCVLLAIGTAILFGMRSSLIE